MRLETVFAYNIGKPFHPQSNGWLGYIIDSPDHGRIYIADDKMISFVRENEDEFVQEAIDNYVQKQSSELAKSKKKLKEAEKRIAELDRLFTRLYKDNVSGKISDERFSLMSAGYEDEQKKLRATVAELYVYIDNAEQK